MATDWEPADTVSGESLVDFIDRELAREEASKPPDYDAIMAVLESSYTRADGWAAIEVQDNYGRDVELAAPTFDQLYAAVKRFYLR